MKSHSVKVVKDLNELRIVNEQLIKEKESYISEKDDFIYKIVLISLLIIIPFSLA